MKKLITAVAIVCASVMANAATANWKASASNIYDGKGEQSAVYTGTAFIFDAGKTTQEALFAMIVAGESIGATTEGYVTTASVNNGSISASATAFGYGEQGDGITYNYYFAIVDDGKAYFSNIKGSKPNGTATAKAISFGMQYDDEDPLVMPNSTLAAIGDGKTFGGAGVWSSTAAIPEPTSGLMLLLGMAGLALRRRRA